MRVVRIIGLLIVLIAPADTRAQLLAALHGHSKTVTSVSYSPDGQFIATGSWDHSIRIWSAVTHQPVATLNGHTGAVTSVAYRPDGDRIISGGRDHAIRVWDARTYQPVATLSGHTGSVTTVAYSRDGSAIISGSEDHTVMVWDAATHQLTEALTGHAGVVYSVSYSPNGKSIISGGWDGAINIWSSQTYQLKKTLSGQLSVVYAVAFSPDGEYILGGRGDGTVNIWNARTYQLIQTLKGHSGTVTSVSSHPDGLFIIGGHGDGSINIWNARTFQLSRTLNGHAGIVTSVCFSPDGEEVVSGSGDYLVNIWDFFPMMANLRSPPDLYAEISFAESDDDGYLDADEVGNLRLKLTNKGKGDALNLKLMMTLAEENPQLHFENRSLGHLKSGDSRRFEVAVVAGIGVRTQLNVLRIEITEQQGHHMDPLEFAFFTQSLKVPRFELLGVEIDDDDEADSFGRSTDGMVQRGEQIEARVSIQNQGSRESPGDAYDVAIRLTNGSPYIDVHSADTFYRKRLKLGEVFEFDLVFSINKAYTPTEPLLPLRLDIREKYGMASVSELSLGIELEKKTRADPPLVITPKPARLGRAKFDRLGSRTTVVFEQRQSVEEAADKPRAKSARENALAVIIGMPDVASSANDAALMRICFQHALGIPASDIKVYSRGMNRNDFVTLFEQKLGAAVDADTELYVFYSGGGVVDEGENGYLLPLDGSRTLTLTRKTWYPLSDLYGALDALTAKSKTIILDVHSPAADGKSMPYPSVYSGESPSDLTVISCWTGGRTDRAARHSKYGLLTHFLAAGLKGDADRDANGIVTLGEIGKYVQKNVAAQSGGTNPLTIWTRDGNYDRVFAEFAPAD